MKTSFHHYYRKGFTLIELLIVIAILATLAGIAYPAYMSIQDNANKTAAKKHCTDIVEGVSRFAQDNNGMLPYDPDAVRADSKDQVHLVTADGKDARLIEILSNREDGDERINAGRETYLRSDEQEEARNGLFIDGSGSIGFYDPWGNPYYVVLCEDELGCIDPFNRRKRFRGKNCLVYSVGADGTGSPAVRRTMSAESEEEADIAAEIAEEALEDNVYSWKNNK